MAVYIERVKLLEHSLLGLASEALEGINRIGNALPYHS